jgi:NAD(P)-dependent dehydrogenase (short-subunit alcohol dehydrogenase family)
MAAGEGIKTEKKAVRVFITGVGKGLGRELFMQLTDRGYHVTGLLRNGDDYEMMRKDLPANATLVLGDVSTDGVIDLIKQHVKEPVSLLINNAGVSGYGIRLDKIEASEVMNVFNVHCAGALRVVKALVPNLLAAHAPVVININSRMGSISGQSNGIYRDLKVSYSYRIAKSAQNMLTACLRSEMGEKISFISLHPGRMKTQKAQVDADMEPSESAAKIIAAWEEGKLQVADGILELPDKVLPW